MTTYLTEHQRGLEKKRKEEELIVARGNELTAGAPLKFGKDEMTNALRAFVAFLKVSFRFYGHTGDYIKRHGVSVFFDTSACNSCNQQFSSSKGWANHMMTYRHALKFHEAKHEAVMELRAHLHAFPAPEEEWLDLEIREIEAVYPFNNLPSALQETVADGMPNSVDAATASEYHSAASLADELAGARPDEGLTKLAGRYKISAFTEGFQSELPQKMETLRLLAFDDRNLCARLLADPGNNTVAKMARLRVWEDLSDFGQAAVLLLVSVGNIASFCGKGQAVMIRNAQWDSSASELRSVLFATRAYELFGEDALVGRCIEHFLQDFQYGPGSPSDLNPTQQTTFVDYALLINHIIRTHRHHFKQLRLGENSPRIPQGVQLLDVADLTRRLMGKAD